MNPLTILATGLYGEDDAKAERRADPVGGAVEIWLQVDQVDREDQSGDRDAANHMEHAEARGSTASIPM